MCFADELDAAAVALLERLVERAAQERGALELLEVAGEERAHELALAEDAREAVALVDHRQRRQRAVQQRGDRGLDVSPVCRSGGSRRTSSQIVRGLMRTSASRRRWHSTSETTVTGMP